MQLLLSDLRYALRTLGRNPGFAAIVILILAIGIGANTVMFSIVDSVLLRSLPFHDPERLFAVQEQVPKFAYLAPSLPVSAHHLREWRKEWRAIQQIAIFETYSTNLSSNGEPERLNIARVSPELFPMLGAEPQIGRNFLPEEDQPGSDKVVLITDALWRRRFHADPSILGQKILLDDAPFTVIGVLPAGLAVPKVSDLQGLKYGNVNPDLWKPLAIKDTELDEMGDFNFACMVRLKPGYSRTQALDELNAIQHGIVERYVKQPIELRALLVPLQSQITGRSRQGLLMLLGAVGAVLLIVCVNIANLLLSRATGRSREFAIRAAVGASSARLLRQMLTESLLIASIGGALGVGMAYAALGVVIANAPADLPRLNEIRIDGTALGAAVLLAAASAILFGLLPALKSSRIDPQNGLRSGGRSSTEGRQSGRLRSTLVGLEVALSTVCLVAAGLLLNSFVRLMHVDRGFAVEHITTVTLNLPVARYPDAPHRADFLRKLVDQVKALPGVTYASVSNMIPLAGEGNNNFVSAEGSPKPLFERPIADRRMVSEDYFRTLAIPLIQGRFFEEADRQRKVAILSAATAQLLWPDQNPLGKRIRMGGDEQPLLEVIGVVGDVRSTGLQKAANMTVYQLSSQRDMSLAIRTAMDPASISGVVRGIIQSLDSEMPVPEFQTMEQIVSASVAERRFQLTLVLLFAGIALVLACLGIYGVVSYSLAQRRNEMGIRIALGATSSSLRGLILRQGLAPVVIGLAAGFVGALAMGRILSGLLFGVSFADPLTMGVVASVLLAVGAAASYFPARGATRTDPLTALRCE
jgi:putative ABC transport system permease protein